MVLSAREARALIGIQRASWLRRQNQLELLPSLTAVLTAQLTRRNVQVGTRTVRRRGVVRVNGRVYVNRRVITTHELPVYGTLRPPASLVRGLALRGLQLI